MTYCSARFYFSSGTGNSFRVAEWLAAAAGEQGIDASVLPMRRRRELSVPDPHPTIVGTSLIGLAYPTHGFTAPWSAIRFALALPPGTGIHALVTPSRGSLRIGERFIPGMSGTAGYLIALILALKGYDIRGVQGIDMPSNWTSLHPGLAPASVQGILGRGRKQAFQFMDDILAGNRRLGSRVDLALGLALAPVSLGYTLQGRFFLAKLFFADSRCKSCGLCVRHCPEGAIKMVGWLEKRPYWTFSCESCMRCLNFCPNSAIQVSHGFAVASLLAMGAASRFVQVRQVGGHGNREQPAASRRLARSGVPRLFVLYAERLGLLWLLYRLFHELNSVPAARRLLDYTALTRFDRRYHEPDVSLRELDPLP